MLAERQQEDTLRKVQKIRFKFSISKVIQPTLTLLYFCLYKKLEFFIRLV